MALDSHKESMKHTNCRSCEAAMSSSISNISSVLSLVVVGGAARVLRDGESNRLEPCHDEEMTLTEGVVCALANSNECPA